MSGFVALLNRDGAPVDRALLERMTALLAAFGADEQRAWSDGPVGLGHALLRTTDEAAAEHQPCTLDGTAWIAGDVRVDGRGELAAALRARGRAVAASATDPELVLHAYAAWGDGCVDHLLGDFSFVVWDAARRRLFGARDHFGVRPFFYAATAGAVTASTSLRCVRMLPGVGDELDDSSIADYLLFGHNLDLSATAFAAVRRLPPAHLLVCDEGREPVVRRYWSLPVEEPLRYRRAEEYVERFGELFGQAVRDRLRTPRVGVTMSGGLDSPAVAAVAARQAGSAEAVRAYNICYDRLFADEERAWSDVAARGIGIAIDHVAADDHLPFQGWDAPDAGSAEPVGQPFLSLTHAVAELARPHSRVVLTGFGSDPALAADPLGLTHALGRGDLLGFAASAARFVAMHRRRPPLGMRSLFRSPGAREPEPFPGWIAPALAARYPLEERWRAVTAPIYGGHPYRPGAFGKIGGPVWHAVFEGTHVNAMGIPWEFRHPFFDVRLIRFLLRVPTYPYTWNKWLLRSAMRGLLPEATLCRPKTLLRGDPEVAERGRNDWIPAWIRLAAPRLERYVSVDGWKQLTSASRPTHLRPLGLNAWLLHPAGLGWRDSGRL